MKTTFEPTDFQTMLSSLSSILEGLVRSQNYQDLLSNEHGQELRFTLNDALQGLQDAEEAYVEMVSQQPGAVEFNF